MALPSGLGASVGFGQESTWGTGVSPTRWVPLRSESLTQEIERIESSGIIAGRRVLDSTQWAEGGISVSGDIELDLTTNSMGLLFKHALGGSNTSGSGTYTHTFTPDTLTGKGLTVQIGRPDVGGTVRSFTYAGCKVASWELSASAGELATFSASLVGKSETTATGLTSPSYTAGNRPFVYSQGGVVLGSATPVELCVRSFSISGDNGLSTDRTCIGHQNIEEPLESALRTYEGELEIEFTSLDLYEDYVAAEELTLSLSFDAGAGGSITIDMNIRLDGVTPNVSGSDLIVTSVPFKCVGASTDASAITIEYVNSDSSL